MDEPVIPHGYAHVGNPGGVCAEKYQVTRLDIGQGDRNALEILGISHTGK